MKNRAYTFHLGKRLGGFGYARKIPKNISCGKYSPCFFLNLWGFYFTIDKRKYSLRKWEIRKIR